MLKNNRVFTNRVAVSSCAGSTLEDTFEAILNGKSGVKISCDHSNTEAAVGLLDNNKSFNLHIADLLESLCLSGSKTDTFLVVGSSVGGMLESENSLLSAMDYGSFNPKKHAISSVKDYINTLYPFKNSISFSTACTSSANAIVFGYELIRAGAYDRVVVAGVDSISRTTVGGFNSLGVLSSTPCKPFDINRSGMNVAEGISFLCLESHMKDSSVEILGCGVSSDAHNIAHPHPNGDGAYASMLQAIDAARINPSDIDYINAHGTATIANDNSEAAAIYRLCGNNAKVSSTKSITGHTLGAAGAMELAITYQAIRKEVILKNSALETAENGNINLPIENIYGKIKYALSNSFAFGGNNVSILLGAIS